MNDNIENDIKLTDGQLIIYNNLVNFVKEELTSEILLIGYAGTGKTTLVTKFINDVIKNKLCRKIVIAAPTHKAVNIAKSKLFDNINSNETISKNINIMTIHRLLNYQSQIDLDGNRYFSRSGVDPVWSIYDLIVIDECSMLSNQIISDIDSQINNNKNSKIKIIYVGDPAQLPPVNQTNSEIFNKKIKSLTLDKIIRTKNPEIINLSNDHRKWIFSKKEDDIPQIFNYMCDKIKLYSCEDNQTNLWLEKFIKLLNINNINNINDANNINNNIILTWTNKKCNKYNKYVREKIFNKKDLNHYEIGEILIFNDFHRIELNTNIVNSDNKYEDYEDNIKKEYISFYTSEQIKLVKIQEVKYLFNILKFKLNNNIPIDINEIFKKSIMKINKLLEIEILSESNTPVYNIKSICEKSEGIYKRIIEEFEIIVNKLKNKCYDQLNNKKFNNMKKCDIQSEIEKKINKLYKDWQLNVIDIFAQLNYGYSITVHKSQGSTFGNVFVDINDILNNNNEDETSKCLYTSITRSSDRLELLV